MNILYHLTPLDRLPTVGDLVIIFHICVMLAWLEAYAESADKHKNAYTPSYPIVSANSILLNWCKHVMRPPSGHYKANLHHSQYKTHGGHHALSTRNHDVQRTAVWIDGPTCQQCGQPSGYSMMALWSIAERRTRSQERKIKKKEKDAQPTKINREIVFSDLRNPPKNFTPLFGEVVKIKTHTEHQEHAGRDDQEFEHCVLQTTLQSACHRS